MKRLVSALITAVVVIGVLVLFIIFATHSGPGRLAARHQQHEEPDRGRRRLRRRSEPVRAHLTLVASPLTARR